MKSIILALFSIVMVALDANAQQYVYDAAGRLTIVRYANGLETRYTYDKNGNILKAKTDVINSVADADLNKISVAVMPNPTASTLTVSIDAANGERIEVMAVSSLGEVVLRANLTVENRLCRVDVNKLASGAYTLLINNASLVGRTTFLVIR